VCLAIRAAPEKVFDFTYLGRAVAIVTDESAILGLGNIGPRRGLPVIEGRRRSLLAGRDQRHSNSDREWRSRSLRRRRLLDRPSFGAIQLEDIGAPRCFEIEQKLRARLSMPVLHDDQHATAVVVLAALLNATRQTGCVARCAHRRRCGPGCRRSWHRASAPCARCQAASWDGPARRGDGALGAAGRHRESLKGILARADASSAPPAQSN